MVDGEHRHASHADAIAMPTDIRDIGGSGARRRSAPRIERPHQPPMRHGAACRDAACRSTEQVLTLALLDLK
jgi:hypothetical protein